MKKRTPKNVLLKSRKGEEESKGFLLEMRRRRTPSDEDFEGRILCEGGSL